MVYAMSSSANEYFIRWMQAAAYGSFDLFTSLNRVFVYTIPTLAVEIVCARYTYIV